MTSKHKAGDPDFKPFRNEEEVLEWIIERIKTALPLKAGISRQWPEKVDRAVLLIEDWKNSL